MLILSLLLKNFINIGYFVMYTQMIPKIVSYLSLMINLAVLKFGIIALWKLFIISLVPLALVAHAISSVFLGVSFIVDPFNISCIWDLCTWRGCNFLVHNISELILSYASKINSVTVADPEILNKSAVLNQDIISSNNDVSNINPSAEPKEKELIKPTSKSDKFFYVFLGAGLMGVTIGAINIILEVLDNME